MLTNTSFCHGKAVYCCLPYKMPCLYPVTWSREEVVGSERPRAEAQHLDPYHALQGQSSPAENKTI